MAKSKRKQMRKNKRKQTQKVKAGIDEGKRQSAPNVTADTDAFEIKEPNDLRDELLPGLPNDLAWQVIAPKLSGASINVLSLVSPSWRAAIHGRWVYDARVRSHLTETFIAIFCSDGRTIKFSLYSLNDHSRYKLPLLPSGEFLNECKCIPLDGKIYVLGGAIPYSKLSLESDCLGRKHMFMLDLAGHKQWKQCGSMQEGRLHFGAGVLDGKIYVIGGSHDDDECMHECEVYDPKVDAWSPIADLTPSRFYDNVAAIGGELFVYGGLEWSENPSYSRYVVAYNPLKNEWRQVGHFDEDERENPWVHAFVTQGKFHKMTMDGIDVYDMDTNSWSNLHSCLQVTPNGLDTQALNDEIVTKNYLNTKTCCGPDPGIPLVVSRGFGSTKRKIAFENFRNYNLRHDLCCLDWSCNYEYCVIQL